MPRIVRPSVRGYKDHRAGLLQPQRPVPSVGQRHPFIVPDSLPGKGDGWARHNGEVPMARFWVRTGLMSSLV